MDDLYNRIMSYKEPLSGVAVVTGGAAGLGAAFVEGLLASGHDVAVLDLSCDEDAHVHEPTGRRVLHRSGDASDPDQVAAFAADVRAELGSPRVLVNNVGASPYRTFADETLAGWRHVMALNVESAVVLTQAFLPDLVADGEGRIVNLSSSVVWDAENRGMVAYAAAKAAIVGLTRALATELGEHGVTVNCIAPGFVVTPDTADRVPQEKIEGYRRRQAVPRIATPEDLVSSLDFLVSRASGQVTGTVLGVNGGRVWL